MELAMVCRLYLGQARRHSATNVNTGAAGGFAPTLSAEEALASPSCSFRKAWTQR